jgi:transposase
MTVTYTDREAVRPCKRWSDVLWRVGLESGSMSPWLARALRRLGYAVVCTDSRRVKSDKADADAMARHYLYEAADGLLTTVRSPLALKSWGSSP